ncbi:MAG: DUF5050 domain-containing protein [Defluviitaleaceae bacterium]|nr:DUF5050 domain-containing protein [Defluviitaleaceae bacterium]
MAMVLPTFEDYTVEDIISNTPFYTNYKASSSNSGDEHSYIITEFNPSFMVRRTETGALEVTERFLIEYETAFERFVKLGEAFKNLEEQFIAKITEFIQTNNTAYIVRVIERYGNLEQEFPNSERMDFNDAYVAFRPLLQGLVSANKLGLFFQYEEGSFCVNHHRQLMFDSMFNWEDDHMLSIKSVTGLFYRLVAGYDFGSSGSPTIDDLSLPPKLTKTFKEILEGEPTYGSLDDFSKQLRTVMEAEGRKDIIAEKPKTIKPSKPVKKIVGIAVIAAVSLVMITLVTVPFILVSSMMNEDPEEMAYEEDGFVYQITQIVPTAFVRMHTAYAITDPRDPTVMLNGAFFQQAGSLYFRSSQGGGALLRQSATGADTVLATNVRPAFITVQGNYIYFSDGFADYNVRRVHTTGGDVETISENMASFLQVASNNLFYTNHNNRDFLYRLDLNTLESEPFLRVATYETIIHAGQIYFINGNRGFRVYTVPLTEPTAAPVRLNNANSDNLRISGGYIFYRNLATSTIHRMTLGGGELSAPIIPFAVASFDINGNTMAIIEENSQEVWIYNIATGELQSTGAMASYAVAGNNMAYIIDYNDSTLNRLAELPIISPYLYQYDNEDFDELDELSEEYLDELLDELLDEYLEYLEEEEIEDVEE